MRDGRSHGSPARALSVLVLVVGASRSASPAELAAFVSVGLPTADWGRGYGGIFTITLFNLVHGEVEGARQGSDLADTSLLSLSAKVYVGPTIGRFVPYVGLGVGVYSETRPGDDDRGTLGTLLRRHQVQAAARRPAARGVRLGQPAGRRPREARRPLLHRRGNRNLSRSCPAVRTHRRELTAVTGTTCARVLNCRLHRNGLPQLHHDAGDVQDRLLRSWSVRQDHEPAVDPPQDGPGLPRRDGQPRDRGGPHALLRPAAARRRHDRRDEGAPAALHRAGAGLLQHDAPAGAEGRRRRRVRGGQPGGGAWTPTRSRSPTCARTSRSWGSTRGRCRSRSSTTSATSPTSCRSRRCARP